MAFVARINHPELRMRWYLHATGSNLYGATLIDVANEADRYVREKSVHFDFLHHVSFSYFLGMLWGLESRNERIFELYGYRDLRFTNTQTWQESNPDVVPWVFVNGVYTAPTPPSALTCGDGMIMLGREEEYRRTTSDLGAYLDSWPHLGAIEPSMSLQSMPPQSMQNTTTRR